MTMWVMNIPNPTPLAEELDRVASALDWTLSRDDWWGPARVAFDSEITQLRDTTRALAQDARALP